MKEQAKKFKLPTYFILKTKNLKKFEQMFEPFRGTIIVNCQET